MSEYEELYEEIKYKNDLLVEGVSFPLDFFIGKDTGIGENYEETINAMFARDKEAHKGYEYPSCFLTPKGGYQVQIRWNKSSRYELTYEKGKYNIHDRFSNKIIYEDLHFMKRPGFYRKRTKDGAPMKSVVQDNSNGAVFICYSNECALKDKGEDCLFCNINATKSIYGEDLEIEWKNPVQIAESVKAAYDEGYNHLTISGGFIPERREVEYYLDVGEAIADELGEYPFNGTACVGAPSDFSIFAKYKEAGFSTIATNMELWNPKLFDYYCPGKSKQCGDHDRWLKALLTEVEVFGKYHVRTNFVSGLETKESLLDGISYLVSHGVVALPDQWYVNVGSALEGHRTPEASWHLELQERAAEIYINNGLDWNDMRRASGSTTRVVFDLYRLNQGIKIDRFGNEIRNGVSIDVYGNEIKSEAKDKAIA